jgi:hypothetical protein
MKLFQFWDGREPPEEVKGWMDGFRDRNPDLDYVRFDADSAAEFIANHYGPREVAAFRACAVPAMQADYIRLCAINIFGGVYVDADNQCLQPLEGLLARAPNALLFTWLGLVNNGFMFFRHAGDAFIRACLALTLENIEARRFNIEFTATGPGVFNAIRALIDPTSLDEITASFDNSVCRPWGFDELLEHARRSVEVTTPLVEAYRAITLLHALAASPWIGADQPAYKKTNVHWINWDRPIYRGDGTLPVEDNPLN